MRAEQRHGDRNSWELIFKSISRRQRAGRRGRQRKTSKILEMALVFWNLKAFTHCYTSNNCTPSNSSQTVSLTKNQIITRMSHEVVSFKPPQTLSFTCVITQHQVLLPSDWLVTLERVLCCFHTSQTHNTFLSSAESGVFFDINWAVIWVGQSHRLCAFITYLSWGDEGAKGLYRSFFHKPVNSHHTDMSLTLSPIIP